MDVDNNAEAIREAERTVYAAGWRLQEEAVARQLAGTTGLARAPLMPGSEVIQVVTFDGDHLGYVRRDRPRANGEQWVAVPRDHARSAGAYRSPQAAAWALARASGKKAREIH